MEIILYKNSAEHNRLDKTDYLEAITTIEGTLREPFSLTGGSIIIQLDAPPTFNYVYIENFERYYFVTEVTVLSNTLYEISLDVDVLMSFKDAILNTKCFVDRNEHDFDENIPDNYRTYESGFDVETVAVENDFLNIGASYILSGLCLDIQEAE